MKRCWKRRLGCLALVAVVLMLCGSVAWGSERMLRGDVWMTMSPDEKVAYLWGAGDVVDLEQALWEIHPELKQQNFSAKVVEGMADIPMNDIVATVDEWYRANPDKRNLTVIRVIWDTLIKPNLKTGIAGGPVE